MAAVQDSAAGPRRLALRGPRSAQVVVVGAGLSGLQAALDVEAAGATCLVLEARDCIGGRDVEAVLDAARHVRLRALAQRLGLEAAPLEGRDAVEGLGASEAGCISRQLADDDRRSWTRVTENLEALCQRVDVNRPAALMPNYGATSVDELVASQGGTPTVRNIAHSWTLAIFGLSSRDVSALYFLAHCKSAGGLLPALSDARCIGGSSHGLRGLGQLRRALVARLRPGTLCLSQRVESIDQTGSRCLVTTQAGRVFQCAKVILAAPAAQCRTVRFAPELSGDKQWLRTAGEVGSARRVAVAFDRPWWRERGLSGRAVGLDGPIDTVADADADGRAWLTCLVAGEPRAPLDEQQDVLCRLEAIFGDVPAPSLVARLGPETPCLAVPAACLRSLERDQWRPEGSVLFAGAETSHVSRGHAEGALAAGNRAAEEALWALRPQAMPSARL